MNTDDNSGSQVEQTLQESAAHYRDLVELSPDAIVILQDGHYRFVNSSFCRIFGYSLDEVRAGLSFYKLVQEKDLAAVRERYQARLAGQVVPTTFRLDLVARSGRVIPCETAARLVTHGGRPADLVLLRDISERVGQEAAQRDIDLRMQQVDKLETLGIMAGGIAHDFNNLLVSMLGNAELVRLELAAESGLLPYVQDIEHAAKRAAELVQQLLHYSGRGRLTKERIDLRELLRQMRASLQGSLPPQAAIQLDTSRWVPPTEADPSQLRQMVSQLVSNAVEALGDDPGSIIVRACALECSQHDLEQAYLGAELLAGVYSCIEINDSGEGMDSQTLERIFEPFFSTRFAGRGMGLASVLGIVRGHGGAIRLFSEPGRGTTVQVLLPAQTGTVADEQQTPRPPSGWRPAGTVLLIDDEAAVRALAAHALERMGFEVVQAGSGREGLRILEREPQRFVLVLLDLTMPGLDGEQTFTLLHRIRSDLPVLLCSGYDEQELERRFGDRRLAGFLHKPYGPASLAERVYRALS